MMKDGLPSSGALAWPTLVVLRESGGTADIRTISEKVRGLLKLTPEQCTALQGRGKRTVIDYRLAWARSLLKRVGTISNNARGAWSLTPLGETVTEEGLQRLIKAKN